MAEQIQARTYGLRSRRITEVDGDMVTIEETWVPDIDGVMFVAEIPVPCSHENERLEGYGWRCGDCGNLRSL